MYAKHTLPLNLTPADPRQPREAETRASEGQDTLVGHPSILRECVAYAETGPQWQNNHTWLAETRMG